MSEKLDAALRNALEKMMRAGPHPALSNTQPVVDAVRAIVQEEVERRPVEKREYERMSDDPDIMHTGARYPIRGAVVTKDAEIAALRSERDSLAVELAKAKAQLAEATKK